MENTQIVELGAIDMLNLRTRVHDILVKKYNEGFKLAHYLPFDGTGCILIFERTQQVQTRIPVNM